MDESCHARLIKVIWTRKGYRGVGDSEIEATVPLSWVNLERWQDLRVSHTYGEGADGSKTILRCPGPRVAWRPEGFSHAQE